MSFPDPEFLRDLAEASLRRHRKFEEERRRLHRQASEAHAHATQILAWADEIEAYKKIVETLGLREAYEETRTARLPADPETTTIAELDRIAKQIRTSSEAMRKLCPHGAGNFQQAYTYDDPYNPQYHPPRRTCLICMATERGACVEPFPITLSIPTAELPWESLMKYIQKHMCPPPAFFRSAL